MNKEDIIEILKELQICIFYAGVRADGNINGEDLVNALGLRCKELSAREGETTMKPSELPKEVKCYYNPNHKAFRDYVLDDALNEIWLVACPKCKNIGYDSEAENLQSDKLKTTKESKI